VKLKNYKIKFEKYCTCRISRCRREREKKSKKKFHFMLKRGIN